MLLSRTTSCVGILMHDIVTLIDVPFPISLLVRGIPWSICTPNVIANQAILHSYLANLLTQRSRCNLSRRFRKCLGISFYQLSNQTNRSDNFWHWKFVFLLCQSIEPQMEFSDCVIAHFFEVKSPTFPLGLKVEQTFARCFVLLKYSSILFQLENRLCTYPFIGGFFVGQ